MSHSKIYQKTHAYKLEIDILETRCPICNKKHLRMSLSGNITCKCGYVVINGHDYCAEQKINKNIDFKINKIKPEENGVD